MKHQPKPPGGVLAIERDPRKMEPWLATVAGVRDAALAWMVTAADFSQTSMPLLPEAREYRPMPREVEAVSAMAHDAVVYGRVIDFGELPNEMIKVGGNRGGPLWNKGYFGQPFRDPWILYHTWEKGTQIGIYLVNPVEREPFGDVEVCELQAVRFDGEKMLLISDRGLFEMDTSEALPANKYNCKVAPAMIRFLSGEHGIRANNGGTPSGAAAGNIGDPLMTALMILNTRNIERTTIRASDKLQKARSKTGKLPIPPYDKVNAAPYVTAILTRRKAGDRTDHGGHHASPVPHVRLGHPRHYANGSSTFVRDTLVNVANSARAEFLRTRSHYTVER